jgi:hypothetical protein
VAVGVAVDMAQLLSAPECEGAQSVLATTLTREAAQLVAWHTVTHITD